MTKSKFILACESILKAHGIDIKILVESIPLPTTDVPSDIQQEFINRAIMRGLDSAYRWLNRKYPEYRVVSQQTLQLARR